MSDTDADAAPIRHGMGLKPDKRDPRDYFLFEERPTVDAQPPSADNSAILPPVMDQKVVGACVGYSTAAHTFGTMERDGHRRPFVPSPVFVYRQARLLGGYLDEDAGCEIRNAMKAVARWGLPPLSNLKPRFTAADIADPRTSKFGPKSIWVKEPTASVYADAERRQVIQYFKLPTLGDLLQCLADGYTAVVGFLVFRSMYGPGGPRFHVPDPNPPNDRGLGGHAVLAHSYSKADRRVVFRNSWGADAHEGKPDFTLSFDYLSKYSWDNWTTRFVEGGTTKA